jgi:hypothetical protein
LKVDTSGPSRDKGQELVDKQCLSHDVSSAKNMLILSIWTIKEDLRAHGASFEPATINHLFSRGKLTIYYSLGRDTLHVVNFKLIKLHVVFEKWFKFRLGTF